MMACSSAVAPETERLTVPVTESLQRESAEEESDPAAESTAEALILSETTWEESDPEMPDSEEPDPSAQEGAEKSSQPRRPLGHQVIYEDGEIFGWTQYQYDESGRKVMTVFLSPRGDEYWSPITYDANGHVIPDMVGEWSEVDENGQYVAVGYYDNKGEKRLYAQYGYDEDGNVTDHWYMYVEFEFLRHEVLRYDGEHRLIRMEIHDVKSQSTVSSIVYTYDYRGVLIHKKESGEHLERSGTLYTYYRYDEENRLIREEQVWGGEVHDYIAYTYNEAGELIQEYHYLENPMMGGSYTIEYLYELDEALREQGG